METILALEEQRDVFRRNLRARRLMLGMSQVELAATTGMEQAAISHLESGKRVPLFDTLCSLASALDTTPAALLTENLFPEPRSTVSAKG